MEVLTSAKKMKGDMKFGSIFLAPDRSLDERVAHKQLIEEMKKKREEEPSRYFFIKQGKVCSVETGKNRKTVAVALFCFGIYCCDRLRGYLITDI